MDLIAKVFSAIVTVIVTLCSALQRTAKVADNVAHAAEKYSESFIPSDEAFTKQMELAKQQRQLNLIEKEADLEKQLEKFNKSRNQNK